MNALQLNTMALAVTSREQHLAFRAAWKESYKQITIDIRLAKVAFVTSQKEFSKNYSHATGSAMMKNLYALGALRGEANRMNITLAEAKIRAGIAMHKTPQVVLELA